MKKILVLCLITMSVAMLAGCGNQNKEKQVIIDTQEKVEKIVAEMSSVLLSQDTFSMMFTTYSRDLIIELEEQYDKGNKVFISYDDDNINGKVIGKDKSNSNKYYIYIGSENDKLWSYGTVNLETKKISWENNF